MNTVPDASDEGHTEPDISREEPADDSGFIKFYGLYWRKDLIDWNSQQLLGQPGGWMGKGNVAANSDRLSHQMNFWGQKGVYILYDDALHPVYAGQAGLTRKNSTVGRTIGDRLNAHRQGVYRNGWKLFSWFGFMDVEKFVLRTETDPNRRLSPEWKFKPSTKNSMNLLLASFEAILIEGFAPRFNARGGDLKKAVLVDQYEP